MPNLSIALTIGHKEPTTLQEGDRLFINKRHGTAGFVREGSPIVGTNGDDKFFVGREHGSLVALRVMLSHFGIVANLLEEDDGGAIYRLSQARLMARSTQPPTT